MSQDLPLPIVVQDHRARVGQGRNGAQCQQIRVTGAGADEDHPTSGAGAVGVAEVGSGAYEPRMCSLTSRVLLFSSAASWRPERLFKRLLPQLRQHLTSVGDPELLRISRTIRAPPAVGLSPLWWVLTSCSVTFSQLPPSESNRDLYHGQL